MAEMTIVKVRGGYAVSGGESYFLTEPTTKREAQEWIDNAKATRAMLEQHRAEQAAQPAAPSDIEMRRRAANDRRVEFVRLGYAGVSLDFSTDVTDADTFRRCIAVMDSYNHFDAEAVAEHLGGIFGELMKIDVGREASPVLYVYLPFTAQQRAGSREGCIPIPEDEREALKARIMALGKTLHADEISAEDFDGRPYKVRLWWD